jgi:hypothetical protein
LTVVRLPAGRGLGVSLPNQSSTGKPANLAQEVLTGAASLYILALRASSGGLLSRAG